MNAELAASIAVAETEVASPVPLRLLTSESWDLLAAGDPSLRCLGLWVADQRVHALFAQEAGLLFVARALDDGRYRALSPGFADAAWFERLARDVTATLATGGIDNRPAIAHGVPGTDAAWPRFIETEGDGVYQIGEGPVSGIIARPMHRRSTLAGDRVIRVEHRLGYAHRGITALMLGKSPRVAARFAARIAGDATVAHAVAFAAATEGAADCPPPPRAIALRASMLAVERITADLAALSATLALADRGRLATALGRARADIAEALGLAFGHRLMMDVVIPGGLAADIRADAVAALVTTLAAASQGAKAIGRAGVRRDFGAAASLALARAKSVIALAGQAADGLAALPEGVIVHPLPAMTGMAIGIAASARGVIHHWLRIEAGQIAGSFVLDPSSRLLAGLEAAAIGKSYRDLVLLAEIHGIAFGEIDG